MDHVYLQELIRDAVHRNTKPGVTGAVLSGGIDSSTVVALADDLPTFTGYYDHPAFDERHYARLIARSNHTEILITPQDFIDNFDAMVPHLKEPFQGMGTFGQYMVGKHIAENTDLEVILSGEGSDELFGGYARLHIVAGIRPPRGYENYALPDDYPVSVSEALGYDYRRLPELLAVDDQCMAAHGLEARAPFTDQRIVSYALDLPPWERVGKVALKAAVRGIVPDAIVDRDDKMGFPIPLAEWAQDPLAPFILDRIDYLPDPAKPWDRGWWHHMIHTTKQLRVAA